MEGIYKDAQIKGHVIMNSDFEPVVDEYTNARLPVGWNPIVVPPISFHNFQPYIDKPHRLIDVRNQFGMPAQIRIGLNNDL